MVTGKQYRCCQCGKTYTSAVRLRHHRAAEHGVRTSRDIRTIKDIPRSIEVKPLPISADRT